MRTFKTQLVVLSSVLFFSLTSLADNSDQRGVSLARAAAVNLLEQNVGAGGNFEQFVEPLKRTVQLLIHRDAPFADKNTEKKDEANGHPTAQQQEAWANLKKEVGEQWLPLCSGSFVGRKALATAAHCFVKNWGNGQRFSSSEIANYVRVVHHAFRVQGNRLKRTASTVYRLSGRTLHIDGDFLMLQLVGQSPFNTSSGMQISSQQRYDRSASYSMLGYPGSAIFGVPYVNSYCSITHQDVELSNNIVMSNYFKGTCDGRPGMSGGPVFQLRAQNQGRVGIGTSSEENEIEDLMPSPDQTPLPPDDIFPPNDFDDEIALGGGNGDDTIAGNAVAIEGGNLWQLGIITAGEFFNTQGRPGLSVLGLCAKTLSASHIQRD